MAWPGTRGWPAPFAYRITLTAGIAFDSQPINHGWQLASEAGQNMGSAKIFSLGKLLALDERETLRCFGQYYEDVLATPDGDDHGNIRNFLKSGWKGVEFPSGLALTPRGAFEYEAAQEIY